MALAAALLLSLCVAVAGCSDGGSGNAGARRSGQAKDVRQRLWKVDIGKEPANVSHLVNWATGDTVVRLVEHGTLRGFDARTGHVRWSLKAPRREDGVCTHSQRTNNAGVGVVAYGKDGKYGGKCDAVTAVDTHTGQKLWSRRLPHQLGQYGDPFDKGQKLTVGDRAVAAASDFYGEVKRFAVRSGKPLRKVRWYHKNSDDRARVVGDRIVVYLHSPESDSRHGQLAVYDVDSGKRLWRRQSSEPGHIDHVDAASSHPLTVGLASSSGKGTGLRSYDSHGKPLHTFGENDSFRPVPTAGRQGPALVGQFSNDGPGFTGLEPVYAFDPRSGKQLWRVHKSQLTPVGVVGDRFFGILQTRSARNGSHPATWRLESANMQTGQLSDRGAIPPANHKQHTGKDEGGTAGVAVDKQRMYLVQRSSDSPSHLYLTAYKLPR